MGGLVEGRERRLNTKPTHFTSYNVRTVRFAIAPAPPGPTLSKCGKSSPSATPPPHSPGWGRMPLVFDYWCCGEHTVSNLKPSLLFPRTPIINTRQPTANPPEHIGVEHPAELRDQEARQRDEGAARQPVRGEGHKRPVGWI